MNVAQVATLIFFTLNRVCKRVIYTNGVDLLRLLSETMVGRKYFKFIEFVDVNSKWHLGKTLDCETLSGLNDLSLSLLTKKRVVLDNVSRVSGPLIDFYFMNKASVQNKFVLFVGSSLRIEEPLLNMMLRKTAVSGRSLFFNIGSRLSSNYYIKQVGSTGKVLLKFCTGNHWLVNMYFKSLTSLFIFGRAFSSRSKNSMVFETFVNNGFGLRENDTLFFSGVPTSCLSGVLFGFKEGKTQTHAKDVSTLSIDVSYSALLGESKNSILLCFDHNFTSSNRLYGDVIIPIRNFLERKVSTFYNFFGEKIKTKSSLVRDVDRLFSQGYKKSYDKLVYDNKLLNFGFLGSRLNTLNSIYIKICQFRPLLFFSYEHLYNTADHFLLRKATTDMSIYAGEIHKMYSNNLLLLKDRVDEKKIRLLMLARANNVVDLREVSLTNNRVYLDPDNDVFSNSSVLLLKTYKRLVVQLTNF